jgi:MerR family transcriptional regulator, light-induced transcriptional regulator
MGKYSIKDLERLSGIKAHTIRIWEQRYNIIAPHRTDTNIRTYSDDDLRKILNIALLNKHGIKISHIAEMSDADIYQQVVSFSESDTDFSNQVNALTIAMIEMDEDRFEKIISTNTLRLGFEKTMIRVLYPFLQRVGMMWLTGAINPAQEHFISNLIRQKLIVAIDGQTTVINQQSPKFLLFCPEGELHEIPLLFSNYLLRSRKFRVVYLGISLPFDNLNSVYTIHKPNYLFTILTTQPSGIETQDYINKLSKSYPDTKIVISGRELFNKEFKFPINVNYIDGIDDLLKFLDDIKF